MANIVATRAKLTRATELMNSTIDRIEATLGELKLGLRASITVEQKKGRFKRLVFARLHSGWHLLIEVGSQDKPDECEWEVLRNCSRSERILGLESVPALIDEMSRLLSVEAAKVDSAAASAHAFAVAVRDAYKTRSP